MFNGLSSVTGSIRSSRLWNMQELVRGYWPITTTRLSKYQSAISAAVYPLFYIRNHSI